MGSDDLKKIARELDKHLRRIPSFVGVGIGAENGHNIFLVYFQKLPNQTIQEILPVEWKHIPVKAKKVGKIVPA